LDKSAKKNHIARLKYNNFTRHRITYRYPQYYHNNILGIWMAKVTEIVCYKHLILQKSSFKILIYNKPNYLCCSFFVFQCYKNDLFVKYSVNYNYNGYIPLGHKTFFL